MRSTKKKTKEQFLEQCLNKFGNKYDYSLKESDIIQNLADRLAVEASQEYETKKKQKQETY